MDNSIVAAYLFYILLLKFYSLGGDNIVSISPCNTTGLPLIVIAFWT